jgi:DNA primase
LPGVAISDQDIERVKAAVDITDIIGKYTQLKRVGRNMNGLCPFPSHEDTTPSFSVGVDAGLYYCFGCGRRGDTITFLCEMEGIDIESATERLASEAGLVLRYTDGSEGTTPSR